MSIEQRVSDALYDLESTIGDGNEIERSLAEVAGDYDLKPETLRRRAEKAFGDLNLIKERVALMRAVGSREACLRSAFVKYRLLAFGLTTDDRAVPSAFAASLEKDFGFSTVHESGSLVAEIERAAFYRQVSDELERAIKHAKN